MWSKMLIASFLGIAMIGTSSAQAEQVDKPIQPRVIGGDVAAEGSWPSQVALVIASQPDVERGWFCGGTLVAKRWAVSAAHCVVDGQGRAADPALIDILIGRKNLATSGGQRLGLQKIYIPRNYNSQNIFSSGDLALLKLRQPSRYPAMPIGQPAQAADWGTGKDVFVAGYGANSATLISEFPRQVDYTFPNKLLEAQLAVYDSELCRQIYEGYINPGRVICASAEGKDSCVGDSGGPLAADSNGRRFLVGVVSFGTDVCDSSVFPGVYTRLSAYRPWLGSYMVERLASVNRLSWGRLSPGQARAKKITISNPASLPAKIDRAKIKGSGRFTISKNSCQGYLQPGAKCQLQVRFRAVKSGRYQGKLLLRSATATLVRVVLKAGLR